jgi:hypothetical protein
MRKKNNAKLKMARPSSILKIIRAMKKPELPRLVKR